jgi:hypothetical protein
MDTRPAVRSMSPKQPECLATARSGRAEKLPSEAQLILVGLRPGEESAAGWASGHQLRRLGQRASPDPRG